MPQKLHYDWDKWDKLLESMSDHKLSKLIGCSKFTVYKRRKKLGTNKPRGKSGVPAKYDYSSIDPLLGNVPDEYLAEIVGCSVKSICKRRLDKGIFIGKPRNTGEKD